MTESTAVAVAAPPSFQAVSVFHSEGSFASAQRMALALTSSTIVPENYRGKDNMGNALVAMDMANRMGISPIMVMQNLHVIEGRPSWASKFVIAALNSCGLFGPIKWRITDLGEKTVSREEWTGPKGSRTKSTVNVKIHDKEFIAYATEKATGDILEGPPVTFGMAVQEGWFFKPGSKWQTMPDLMGRYRSASFFGGLYAPHVLNGMQTTEEVDDITYSVVSEPAPASEPVSDAPKGRASGVHAALAKGEETVPAKPAKGAKPAPADATPKPDETDPDDAIDADGLVTGEGEGDGGGDDQSGGDMFGDDDSEFSNA